MSEPRQRNCENEINFCREIDKLKGNLKTKDSQKNYYLQDYFYNKAKHFLKEKTEKHLRLSGNKDRSKPIAKQLAKWNNVL